jgi:hypothetical protein
MVVQVAKQILIPVCHHDGTQRKSHYNEGQWLQAIEVAQYRSPDEADRLSQASSLQKARMRAQEIEKSFSIARESQENENSGEKTIAPRVEF